MEILNSGQGSKIHNYKIIQGTHSGNSDDSSKTSGILFDLRGLLGLGGGTLLRAIFLLCNVPVQSEDSRLWQRAFKITLCG